MHTKSCYSPPVPGRLATALGHIGCIPQCLQSAGRSAADGAPGQTKRVFNGVNESDLDPSAGLSRSRPDTHL